MKYIVWDLISPYDGYGTTECATWEEVLACVKAAVENRKKDKAVQEAHRQWKAGEVQKIHTMVKNGFRLMPDFEVFVTSVPLTEPIR